MLAGQRGHTPLNNAVGKGKGNKHIRRNDKKRGEGIMAHPWVAGRRDWLDEIQAQLDKDFKCELEAMALAPPRERGKGKLSFQNLSHFVEEAIVARDWLE